MSDTDDYYFDDDEHRGDHGGLSASRAEFSEYQPEYVTSYKEDVAAMTGGPTDEIKNFSKTAQKILKAGKEEALKQCRGILNSAQFDNVSPKIRDRVISKLTKMNNLPLFRLEFLVMASLFVEMGIDDKQFSRFVLKYTSGDIGTNEIDIYKYVRYLKSSK